MKSRRASVPFCSLVSRGVARIVALLALAACVAAGVARAAPPDEGATVPDFSLPDLDGGVHTLSEQTAAGPVVLVFFRGAW